jgi:hypothetical protein
MLGVENSRSMTPRARAAHRRKRTNIDALSIHSDPLFGTFGVDNPHWRLNQPGVLALIREAVRRDNGPGDGELARHGGRSSPRVSYGSLAVAHGAASRASPLVAYAAADLLNSQIRDSVDRK